nr:Formate-dependent nitrite reductase, membrane component [Citrobacter werkmanii]
MTPASAFHFESLVWDWPIAIYLFLIGISAGLVTLAILLRRFHPEAGGSGQHAAAHHAGVRAGGDYLRSADSGIPPDAAMDLLETDVPLQLHLGDVDGGHAVPVVYGGAGAVVGKNL